MSRTILIGDVHGCLAELDALLDRCGYAESDDVVFLGDLVAKGPDSRGVVRRAREIGARGVCGNHDAVCLQWWRAHVDGRRAPAIPTSHRRVCESLDADDWQWLDALPFWLSLPSYGAAVVHAGFVPGVPLQAQLPANMTTMRSVKGDGSPSKRIEGGAPWASRWPGPEEVVFGHDAVSGLQRHPFATGIDTGCVYGRALTGYILPDRRLVSVNAGRAWCVPGDDS